MSEQERLSRMVGPGFDPDAGKDLIAESLKASIRVNPEKMDQVRREILASERGSKHDKYIREYLGKEEAPQEESAPISKLPENINVESLLLSLYEIHDELIDIFQRVGLNHEISDKLTTQVWNVEKCITKSGGTVKNFIPEDYVSGLEMPDLEENASKVIATTKRCYRLGSVENDLVEDNGSAIRLTFKGALQNVKYTVNGLIKSGSRGWTGSEAIDYVYKPNGGKMSVRSFEGGKWVNCSDHFEIKWELEEQFPDTPSKQQEKPLNSENNPSDDFGDFNIVTKEE